MSLWVLDLILPFRDLLRNSPLNIHGLSHFQGAQAIAASTPAHLSYQDTRWMTLCPVLPGGRVKSGLGFRVWGLGFRVRVDDPSPSLPPKIVGRSSQDPNKHPQPGDISMQVVVGNVWVAFRRNIM